MERQNAPLESFKEDILPLLLLERLSLRGISRVLDKSLTWISKRTKSLWASLPEDLPIGKLEDATLDLYCLEADEMWSFVGAKDCPEWVWLAVERRTRLVVGYHVGSRDEQGALGLLLSIPRLSVSIIRSHGEPFVNGVVVWLGKHYLFLKNGKTTT